MDLDDPRARSARTKVARTRSKLMTEATSLFEERGWMGAKIEDIAQAAGVSAATAYNHFPTKHALIGHIYGPLIQPSIDEALARLENGDDVSVVLEEHVWKLTSILRKDIDLTVAFGRAVLDYTIKAEGPPSPEDMNDPRNLAPIWRAITRAIAKGQEEGMFRTYPPATTFGPSAGNLLLLHSITRPKATARETGELVLTTIFGALAPERLVEAGREGRPFRNGTSARG